MTNTENAGNATLTLLKITPAGEIEVLSAMAGHFLDAAYEAIDCRSVDVVQVSDTLDVWLDDEGLFAESPQVNYPVMVVVAAMGAPLVQPLVGTAVLARHDGMGNTVSLLPEQITAIRDLFE